jgi:DtxR family Mn-dependent transcriptional regulator
MEPGMDGVLADSSADEVTIDAAGTRVTVTRSVAETVSVLADPAPPPRVTLPEQLVLARDRYGR